MPIIEGLSTPSHQETATQKALTFSASTGFSNWFQQKQCLHTREDVYPHATPEKQPMHNGVQVIDIKTGQIKHTLILKGANIQEMSDVAILPATRYAMVVGLRTDEVCRLIYFIGDKDNAEFGRRTMNH